MHIKHFFDPDTSTLTYVVFDERSRDAVIIDPVLDLDLASGRISFHSLKALTTFVDDAQLNVKMLLETHAHADHLSSAFFLKKTFPKAPLAISEEIKVVQKHFAPIFNFCGLSAIAPTGEQFDRLLVDGEIVKAGTLAFKVLATPGHTPACTSFLFGDALFTGDALFMPDSGTGRCDFPGGSATTLYHSIHDVIYRLPDSTRIFVGHDYQPGGRGLAYMSTVKEQKDKNFLLKQSTTLEEFVSVREERDKSLKAPRLLLPSIQVNINAGELPKPDEQGGIFLKIPLTVSSP